MAQPMLTVDPARIARIARELEGFPVRLAKKVVRSAISASGTVVLKELKQRTPRSSPGTLQNGVPLVSGLLRASMGKKGTTLRDGTPAQIIGARGARVVIGHRTSGEGTSEIIQDPSKYYHLVVKGTRPHSLGGGRMHPGTAPNPFPIRAFDASDRAAVARFSTKLREGIDKEAEKTRRAIGG